MDQNSLTVHDAGLLSFDDFKKQFSDLSKAKGLSDKAADLYDIVPLFFKLLQNIDPTGISGIIDQALSENKAKREYENIHLALYAFYRAISILGRKQIILEESIRSQIPDLTFLYFEKSKTTYNPNKIECFKNIWLNGLLSSDETLEEKAYIFEVVSSFNAFEIAILSLFHKSQGGQSFNDRKPLNVEEISNSIKLDYDRSQQICIGLSGKGFLHDFGLGKYDYEGPADFIMTDYVNLIGKYLSAPD